MYYLDDFGILQECEEENEKSTLIRFLADIRLHMHKFPLDTDTIETFFLSYTPDMQEKILGTIKESLFLDMKESELIIPMYDLSRKKLYKWYNTIEIIQKN